MVPSTLIPRSTTAPRKKKRAVEQLRQPSPHRRPKATKGFSMNANNWELPRSDYLLAALVAIGIFLTVGSLTILPVVLYHDGWRAVVASQSIRFVSLIPISCGLLAAWLCLSRAKRDRMHDRMVRELRD